MKDWQFWMLMASLWFASPFGENKGSTTQVVVCVLCVIMLLLSLFPGLPGQLTRW